MKAIPRRLSRAVDGPEAHLLIANGRVVFIPLDALLEEFVAKARRQAHRLADQDELTETVGPDRRFSPPLYAGTP